MCQWTPTSTATNFCIFNVNIPHMLLFVRTFYVSILHISNVTCLYVTSFVYISKVFVKTYSGHKEISAYLIYLILVGIKNPCFLGVAHLSHWFLCIFWFLTTLLTTSSSLSSLVGPPLVSLLFLPSHRSVLTVHCHPSGLSSVAPGRLAKTAWDLAHFPPLIIPGCSSLHHPFFHLLLFSLLFSQIHPPTQSVQLLHSPLSPWSCHLSISLSAAQYRPARVLYVWKNWCSENLCAAPNQAARMLQFY